MAITEAGALNDVGQQILGGRVDRADGSHVLGTHRMSVDVRHVQALNDEVEWQVGNVAETFSVNHRL